MTIFNSYVKLPEGMSFSSILINSHPSTSHIFRICYESQPGSWLVAICERSENRGPGEGEGGVVVAKAAENRENRW